MTQQVAIANTNRVFAVIDANGDGRVEWADFAEKADALGRGFGLADDAPEIHRLTMAYRRLWLVATDRCFDLVDRDDDGCISHDEPAELYRVARVPGAELAARVAFARMDLDGDGRIDRAELIANVHGLLTAEDDSAKGAAMLGN